MSTIVFTNQKGGTGKSTLTVLAAHHAVDKMRERVCVIDLDPQGNSSKTLQRYSCGISSAELFKSARIAVSADGPEPILLFPSAKALADLERANPKEILPSFVHQVQLLASTFDTTIIDTPPALGLRMSAALMASDYACCPIELEEYSIDGVTDMLKTILGVRQKYNPRLKMLGIIANRFNAHSPRQKSALEDLVANYSEFVIPAKISTRSAIPEALAQGVPPWRLAKSSAREASAEVLTVFELLRKKMGATVGDGVEAA